MLRHGPFFLSFQRGTGLVNITSISGSAIFIKTRNPLRRNGLRLHLFWQPWTHMKNPNFFPIGNAFGFFIFIKDNSY